MDFSFDLVITHVRIHPQNRSATVAIEGMKGLGDLTFTMPEKEAKAYKVGDRLRLRITKVRRKKTK